MASNTSLRASLPARVTRHLARGAVALGACVASSASAEIVVWRGANLVVPATIDGLYINVESRAVGSAGSVVAGWDLNPYSAISLTWFNATGSGLLRYPGVTTGTAGNLPIGTAVGPDGSYGGTGAVIVGSAPGNWRLNSNNYFGFRFLAADGLTRYGFGRFRIGSAINGGDRVITDIAYESTPDQPITVAEFTPRVLVLWDILGPGTTALVDSLESAGYEVVLAGVPEDQWDNTNPPVEGFDAVVHLNGVTFQTSMPPAGQAALTAFVRSGGGFVGSAWTAYEVDFGGRSLGLEPLILTSYDTGMSGSQQWTTTAAGAAHRVMQGVGEGFATTTQAGLTVGPPRWGDATVLAEVTAIGGAPISTPAALVRTLDAGRVVDFAHAGNYSAGLPESNLLKLYQNAVSWTVYGDSPRIIGGTVTSASCAGAGGAIDASVDFATSVQWIGPSGFSSSSTDISGLAPGSYVLFASNASGTAARSFHVASGPDLTPPNIASYTQSASVVAGPQCIGALPDLRSTVVAVDDCPGPLVVAQTPAPGTLRAAGSWTVTLTVADAAGNTASVLSTVSVVADQVEVCEDGIDNDCDGSIDEGCGPLTISLHSPIEPFGPGGEYVVSVRISAPPVTIGGAQLAIHFDASRLALTSVEPAEDGPLGLEIAELVDNATGTLRYAIGRTASTGGLSQPGELCAIRFTVLPGGSLCGSAILARFADVGPFTTRLVGIDGAPVAAERVDLPPVILDSTAPTLIGLPPGNITVPADAGLAGGAFVALPPVTATDECDGPVGVVVVGSSPEGGVFAIGTTVVTWVATDSSGNIASQSRTVTVLDQQVLTASLTMMGSATLPLVRTVRVTAGGQSEVRQVVFDEPVLSEGGGFVVAARARGTFAVPPTTELGCVAAKDPVHSVTGTGLATIVGTSWSVELVLYQGDSNDDDMVEIVDYGLWLADFNAGGVAARDGRSNFNGDLQVNTGDFGAIAVNFFRSGDQCAGGLDGPAPRERISVKELRRRGLGEIAAFDRNRDGWFDVRDVQAALVAPAVPTYGEAMP